MGGIKKTLTLERRKKVVKKTADQYLTVLVASLLITVLFVKIATWGTIVNDFVRIVAVLIVLIFSTWRYRYHRKTLKCINNELKQSEIQNATNTKRKFRYNV